MGYLTLAQRKEAKVAAIRGAIEDLRGDLAAYARAHGGRFLLYGSAASGDLRHDSDVDLLVDFPEAAASDAWRFAEEACWRLGLEPDIRPLAWCRPGFVERIRPQAVALG